MCNDFIPLIRLKAKPDATECVPCLEQAGDVPRLKRFDQTTRDGERTEVLFTNNASIEDELRRTNMIVPQDDDFLIALGDDSHLSNAEAGGAGIGAHPLASAFEDDDEGSDPLSLEGREAVILGQQKRWARYRVERGVAQEGDFELLGMTEFDYGYHTPQPQVLQATA
jgi:hypothetical protein